VWVTDIHGRRAALPGDVIGAGRHIETGADGSVMLVAGAHLVVTVDAASSVDLLEVTEQRAAWRLERGALLAEVTRAGGVEPAQVEVQLAGGRRVSSKDGEVGVLERRDGAVVACRRGAAELVAAGVAAHLSAGDQASLPATGGLTGRTAVPESLTLALEPVGTAPAGSFELHVRGRTSPGAEVTVDGRSVSVAADGSFELTLAVTAETREIHVQSRDALQRKREELFALQRSGPVKRGPHLDPLKTDWRWETPRKG
jgi:hypothetical protein